MMIGDDSVTAIKKVLAVYALEKQMAESHRTNVELRDPQSNYNKMAVAELDQKCLFFGWYSFLNNIGAKTDSINVGNLAYYTKLNAYLKTIPVSYLERLL
jgi:putative endopeptidase